jgi:hypothetical protein
MVVGWLTPSGGLCTIEERRETPKGAGGKDRRRTDLLDDGADMLGGVEGEDVVSGFEHEDR